MSEAEAPGRAGERLARGVCRALVEHGHAVLTEVTLPDGLRMDICALGRDGTLLCVEVKSSRADFLSDAKWPGYLDWCDRLAFAVPEGFPDALLPSEHGLIRADAHWAEVLREGRTERLPPARRRAMTLRFARMAADRLMRPLL